MSLSPFPRKAVLCWCLALAIPTLVLAQAAYVPASGYLTNGGEYAVAGGLLGDQVHPAAAYATGGGFVVWEDNITDTDGLGISAMQLDPGMSGQLAPFRVNQSGAGEQERPQVAMLKDGGAVFVWQSGPSGQQRIYARILAANGTWRTGELQVNTFSRNYQISASVAALADGNIVVSWASNNQVGDNSLLDVYGQILSPNGQKIGQEFQINQYVPFNQRTPVVAPLVEGGFVVAWVSEQQMRIPQASGDSAHVYNPTNTQSSVDIYARRFTASGAPVGDEFLVNTASDICANPSVAGSPEGGFLAAWSQKDVQRSSSTTNSWDIFARAYAGGGAGSEVRRLNARTYGDQFVPKVAAASGEYLVVWSSLGQDGSMEGVYGQVVGRDGVLLGEETQVSTTWISRQMHPAVAADPRGRFLVVWSGYVGGQNSFDLFGQRYMKVSQPLEAMSPPFVHAPFTLVDGAYEARLEVSWPKQAGLPIDHYEIYIDGAATPAVSVAANNWTMTEADGLAKNATHKFRVAYVTITGARSPLSASATGKTWGGWNLDGIPSEWLSQYYGANISSWPPANKLLAPEGPTLMQVFLSGGSPLDSSTWLTTELSSGAQGFFLTWNPQRGRVYQVQSTSTLGTWVDVGEPRFAADVVDSVYVGRSNVGYYRVLLMR